MAWYGGNEYEMNQVLVQRPFGPYGHTYRMLILCNCILPQLLWVRWFRINPVALWILSLVVNVGMWLERYVIVVVSLSKDFLPSSGAMYHGTVWDYATFYGSVGLFFTLLFLFIRVLPVISIAEMRELVAETQERAEHPAVSTPR
jgi:hypothetical protein